MFIFTEPDSGRLTLVFYPLLKAIAASSLWAAFQVTMVLFQSNTLTLAIVLWPFTIFSSFHISCIHVVQILLQNNNRLIVKVFEGYSIRTTIHSMWYSWTLECSLKTLEFSLKNELKNISDYTSLTSSCPTNFSKALWSRDVPVSRKVSCAKNHFLGGKKDKRNERSFTSIMKFGNSTLTIPWHDASSFPYQKSQFRLPDNTCCLLVATLSKGGIRDSNLILV